MQEYSDNRIIDAVLGKKLGQLTDKAKADIKSGKADSVVISEVSVGDEFELKRLRFKVISFRNRGQIVAQLIGVKQEASDA